MFSEPGFSGHAPVCAQQVPRHGLCSVKQSHPLPSCCYQVGSSDGQFDAPYLNGLIYASLLHQIGRVPGVAQCESAWRE